MGNFISFVNKTKKKFRFNKYHIFKISKGNDCHDWELYLLPTISLFSCRSNFIDKNNEIKIKWLNYVLTIQLSLKHKKS